MHLPDQDLAGLGSSEAALSGRRLKPAGLCPQNHV